jgi:hypothetical protein
MRTSASSTMGDPLFGVALISFLRPCAQQKASFNGIATDAVRRGEVRVATVGIDLDRAVEPVEDFSGIFAFTPGPVMEHHARRRRTIPAAVVTQHGPEVAGFRLASPRIEDRSRCLVDIEAGCFPTAAVWPCGRPPGRFRRPCAPSNRPGPCGRLAPRAAP